MTITLDEVTIVGNVPGVAAPGMAARYVEPVVTSCTAAELAQGYEDSQGGDGRAPWQLIAVLMAHGVLECGQKNGRILTACKNWNLGNVKAGTKYEGHFTAFRLNEYLTRGGKRVLVWFDPRGEVIGGGASTRLRAPLYLGPPHDAWHPQCRMRAHLTLAEGIRAKLAFLQQPRFARAWAAALRGDAADYVVQIHAQKYFTADFAPYQRAVISLARSFEPVAKRIASEPAPLPAAEHEFVSNVIALHAQQPNMLAA